MSSIYNNYFLSNKIKVFPCAYRSSTYDASARLNTEYNFTHLPHMVDKASYIIKFNDIPENETTTKLICVIQGYYFEIELDADDFGILQNKYLNICVASPNPPVGTDFIEGPHLCSWDSSDGVEATLDGKPEGSADYCFVGLKISAPTEENPNGKLSRSGYQCYALKLDASAKLPIGASKIENSAGVPISTSFTTGALNVASDKLTAKPDSITANAPVTINSTLEVKDSTATTSILKVTINKPTYIEGANSNQGISVADGVVEIGHNKLTLYALNGNIVSKGTIEAITFNAKSDRRLKENIIDYKPEKSILDLPVKKFDFINGPKNQIGCIAQDLKEICPEIVNENEKGYLSIQESKLVYLLLDEVKKLKNEVEELKRK